MPIEIEQYEIDVQMLMRGLVHELRNPLSAILTASSLLPETATLDEESVMLLDVVRKESRRMNRILTEFSTFVKPPKPNFQNCDLALLTREVIQIWRRDSLELATEIEVSEKLPPTFSVWADPNLVQQSLTHLWNNAVEALPHGGNIELNGQIEGGHAHLRICDNGEGLNSQSQEKAFQPFFSTKGSATGLGLSIARMAVRACGGDCRMENVEGGVCAILELPLASENNA